jgi:thiamine biosynthesis lipoprotein
MQIVHKDRNEARRILETAVTELRRLESIFSIYDETSDLSRLNHSGVLTSPSPELVEVLSTSLSLARMTGGAFDPTVQVLWQRSTRDTAAREPLKSVLNRVGYRNIELSARKIRLRQSNMALSLNGIAQGYITDRIVASLKDAGLDNVLVDCGEIYGAGQHASGRSWKVALAHNPGETISCQNQAIATSSGTLFEPGGSRLKGHIYDPATGMPADRYQSLSVVAPTAMLADGLSTALSVMAEEAWEDVLKILAEEDVRIYGMRKDGTRVRISST